MRRRLGVARLLSLVLAALTAGLVLVPTAPTAWAGPPLRLADYVTDDANALSGGQRAQVQTAVDNLYNARRIRLWVVYVDSFSGQSAETWARSTKSRSDISEQDALFAVAIGDRSYALLPPTSGSGGFDVTTLRRNDIEPLLRNGDWAGAAVAAANGLANPPSSSSEISWVGVWAILVVIGIALLALLLWRRRRRRKRREAEFAAAQRADPSDPNALASVPIDTLDDLSRSIVVDVDNAVRTSDNELALAVEEFGERDTAPFTAAVTNAKTTLSQAFNVRQILDDAVPETPQQRRDLLTRVIVAAARADRELDAQREAFHQLRDLVINAPTRLDTLTQQMVDLTARLEPAQQTMTGLHAQFADTALAAV
ncbi:MAG TPA: TPM domain-containing protein, partial [Mycobacterium sp.]